jgi:hypothetical protein
MAITPVSGQVGSATATSSFSSITVTVPSGITQGNLIYALFSVGNEPITVTPPDSSWQLAVLNQPGGFNPTGQTAIYYLVIDATHAGQSSWVWNISAAHSMYVIVREWTASRGWPTNPLDQTAQGDTASTPTTSTLIDSGTTASTTQASELWVASLDYRSAPQTESGLTAGWTAGAEVSVGTTQTHREVYQAVGTTGPANASFSIPTAEFWCGAIATFAESPSPSITEIGAGHESTAIVVSIALGDAGSGGDQASGNNTTNTPIAVTDAGSGVDDAEASIPIGGGGASASSGPQVANVGPPGIPDTTRMTAQYSIRVLNPSFQVVGAVTGYRKLSIAKRFNNISDWILEMDASDPQAAFLIQPGYGISVSRTIYDLGTGKVVSNYIEIAGPTRKIQRNYAQNTLLLSGKDYMQLIASPTAWPTTSYNFGNDIINGVLAPVPQLYWRMNAASGTSETDRSGHSNTGTYTTTGTGAFQLNHAGLIDDPDTSVNFPNVAFASTNEGYCKLTTPSPATLSGTFTVFVVASNGATGGLVGSRGSVDDSFNIQLGATGFGLLHGDIGTGSAWLTIVADSDPTLLPAFPAAGPYIVCYVVTPTGYTIYFNGNQVGSGTYSGTPLLWDSTHTFVAGNVGTITAGGIAANLNGAVDEVIVWSSALTAAQVMAISAEAQSRMNHQAYDTQTGAAETVLKHYVSVNAVSGSAGFSERVLSGLVVEADAARGSTVTGNARFDRLVAADGTGLLQQLATTGGIGFACDLVNGAPTFRVYTVSDRTASIIFSSALGNLLDFSWERDGPDAAQGGNVVIVAGGQQDTNRVFTVRTDSTSISTWGRLEYFQDARDTTDVATMQQRGDAQLLASKEQQQYSAILAPTRQMLYGFNFFLGDKVTAVIDGAIYQDQIREVDITLDANNAETVLPIMATPNANVIQEASVNLYRRLQQQVSLLSRLQTRQ